MKKFVLAVLTMVIGTAASAQEWVASRGQLDDNTFYHQIACAAQPGGACAKPIVRWSAADARDLTVSVRGVQPGYPAARSRDISAALASSADI